MADVEDGFESSSCHTTIDLESLRDGTPNSFCSTPELEIRGNESCLANDTKQSPKRDGSLAFNSSDSSLSLPNETNTTLSHPQMKDLENIEGSSTGANCKETKGRGSKSSVNKDECGVECKWISCHVMLKNAVELSEHVRTAHVEPMSTHHDVFVCLWEGCKVFDKPSLSHSWLSKHVNAHTGVKPFKCMISGCSMTFSSREGLARHVPSHFNDTKPTKRQKSENDSSPKKVLKKKRKKKRILRQAKPPAQVKEDFIDQHTVSSIKEKLPHVMPVSCYRLGIDGANIVFQSKVLGRRTEEKSGEEDVLLRWLPEDILPDEWVPLNEVQKHRTRTVHISQLPNDVAADLDPSFYRRLSHRKHHRK